MDAKQIQLLKETHMKEVTREDGTKTTLGAYMRFCLDGGIDFITSKDLVVFDDTNNMLHCIAINEDGRSQADYPVKMISTDYGIIQQVESIYSQKDFEKALKEGFLKDVVSEEKRNAMLSWSHNIRNQAIQPSRPFYTFTDPTVIPMGNTFMASINEASALGASNIVRSVSSAAELSKLLDSNVLKPGDSVAVDADVVFDEDFTLKGNGITLRSNGATFNKTLKVEGNYITINGFTFKSTNDEEDAYKVKGAAMLSIAGSNVVVSECTFTPEGKYYNAININGNATIESNTFSECKGHIYNLIEFSQNKNYKISNVNISFNIFAKDSSSNNTISMFQFEDNAVVNITDNVWEYSANALRISNYSKATGVSINCINNTYKETTDGEYAGFVFTQGTNQNKDMSGITINLIKLVGPNGKVLTENTDGKNKVWYTYSTEVDPVVKFY